jgi:hypothetical protein
MTVDEIEAALRFDVYVVVSEHGELDVRKLCSDAGLIAAKAMAGVDDHDFIESVANEGWVGTCPEWTGFLPVVTTPCGAGLGLDQLEFILAESTK